MTMPKRIGYFSLGFVVLLLGGYQLHGYVLGLNSISLSFSLWKVYLFHFCFSWAICVLFELLSSQDKLQQQLGFLYLGTIFLKFTLFSAVFSSQVFAKESLPNTAVLSMLVPLFLFLFLEVFYLSKLLQKTEDKKKQK